MTCSNNPTPVYKRYNAPESCIGCPDLSKEMNRCLCEEIYPECMSDCPCGKCLVKGICVDACDELLNFGKRCAESHESIYANR